MNFYKNIKSDALLALKNNLLKAIAITILWLTISFIFFLIETFTYKVTDVYYFEMIESFRDFIFGKSINLSLSYTLLSSLIIYISTCLIYCAIFSVLKMGDILWNYSTIHKKDNQFFCIFNYFSSLNSILKSWYISIQIFIRKIIWAIIIFLPPTVVGYWSILATVYQSKITNKFLIPFGFILLFCLTIVCTIIYLIFCQRYALTRYLIVSGECKTTREAIKLSIKIMNGKKIDYILLNLSFLGWIISCIFIIPIFFVLPYIKISITLYSRYIIEEYNEVKQIK